MQTLTRTQLQQCAELLTRKGRLEHQTFLVEGEKLINEAERSGWELRQLILTEEYAARRSGWLSNCQVPEQRRFIVNRKSLRHLSSVITPPEVVAVVVWQEASWEDICHVPYLVCCVDIADPGNLGTMLRTADWFGVQGVILSPHTVDLYNDKVVRSAMGSLFRLKVYQSPDLLADLVRLKAQETCLVATNVRQGQDFLPPSLPVCLLMGSESHGLMPEYAALSDWNYCIPGAGTAESLNVAVSFGIALYQSKISYGTLSAPN